MFTKKKDSQELLCNPKIWIFSVFFCFKKKDFSVPKKSVPKKKRYYQSNETFFFVAKTV